MRSMSNHGLRRRHQHCRRSEMNLVRSLRVVEMKIPIQVLPGFVHRPVFVKIDFLVLDRPPEPFDENVVEQSMLIRIPCPSSSPVNSGLVNYNPWSVLKISGFPNRSASPSASRQKSFSNVVDNAHEITVRLNTSMIATR